ncbi:hypothetical protein ABC304_13045 [Microbacterium sp. 1P10UB]|uniref:hypothetical protein n=1 Tax=unclassified Microbacterium TaxID=2609290 RepID=UPI0039A135E6
MTTPEQPEQRTLTRKEMRQIRDTSSTPIVSADQVPQAAEPSAPVAAAPAPLPRPAAPVEVAPAPVPDASVDLGVAPLTRRQARQQERIRTASVPVITPDMAAAHAEAARLKAEEAAASSSDDETQDAGAPAAAESDVAEPEAAAPADSAAESDVAQPGAGASADDGAERVTLSPSFGSELLAGEAAPAAAVSSFDQLLARGSAATGAVSTPNALILTQTPEGAIMGPVAATGEVLITGTFALPEGLGSQGHAPGTADGHEADAVLIDGELPAHSSPTPIAASAAVSTIKTTGDIIRPPAPEKGSRLMLALAITAGVLAIAVVGVLIVAVATGVFA